MRKFMGLMFAAFLALSACGGGGGDTTGGGGGGGGGGNGTQVIATPGPPNVEPLVMDAGPANAFNTAFVSVKICSPGSTTNCQTIDHIEVDTGSSGFRVLASALTITLPGETTAGSVPIAECVQFADGSSFGPVATADITLPTSGETASGINVQVIGGGSYSVPSDCPGPSENTVTAFGANGIIGVGPFIQDCGPGCVSDTTLTGYYYNCPTPTTCTDATVTLAEQVSNPVASFMTDNNGVIVEVPNPASAGVASLSGGSLVFGIGTQTNNALASGTTVLPVDDSDGFIRASFNGTSGLNAVIDSGSNLTLFSDSSIPSCTDLTGFFCPSSTLSLTASMSGASGSTTATADFTVVNADNLFGSNPSARVAPGVAGPLSLQNQPPNPLQFDLGMPFFFGRNIYTAMEGHTAAGVAGPYFAY